MIMIIIFYYYYDYIMIIITIITKLLLFHQGKEERDSCFEPIINELSEFFAPIGHYFVFYYYYYYYYYLHKYRNTISKKDISTWLWFS